MTPGELARLRFEVERMHGTIHAFCRRKAGRLNRSTVYLVLSGRYAGNVDLQAERIRTILNDEENMEVKVLRAIKSAACARCNVTTPGCDRCAGLFAEQARRVIEVLNG